VARYSCPHCGSSDGADYVPNPKVEGMMKCFVCDKAWVENKEGGNSVPKEEFKDETLTEVSDITSKIRGISPEIFKQFSYFRGPQGEHVANMYNKDGRIVAQKMRYKDKTFRWVGNKKDAVPFGMNQWRMGGRRITITEGEIDAMSIAEALGGKFPVISITGGAQSAKKDLKEHIEFLNSYDEIVLWFDQDEPGIKAVQEVSSLFPAGKVYTVDTGPYKDANEILQDKGKTGVMHYYYEIKKYTPAGIVNANEGGFDALMEDTQSDSVYSTQYKDLEIAKGAMTTFVSGSGMGKSTIVREIGHHLLTTHNLVVGHVAL